MGEALALGERARGRSAPNPNVGCVIVSAAGRTIGRGPISERSSRYNVISSTPRPIWLNPRSRNMPARRCARISPRVRIPTITSGELGSKVDAMRETSCSISR